ncbi:TlpA disulfide reductase family protein [Paenibacillus naphthalenovorans]|uniref:TlpA disulfide reductase family protein n=1 Tax=Paenibacillus naphthalenovorans TaxID=162209 RepID=UPI003D268B5C
MKRNAIVNLAIVVLLVFTCYSFWNKQEDSAFAAPNAAAPEVKLPDLDGRWVDIRKDADGKAVFLVFWTSWCEYCKKEASVLGELYGEFKERIAFYAVNVTHQDDLKEVRSFVQAHRLPFPVLLDEKGEVTERYRVEYLPTFYLIGRDGIVEDLLIGEIPRERLLGKLQELAP